MSGADRIIRWSTALAVLGAGTPVGNHWRRIALAIDPGEDRLNDQNQ
jgi:hypothetical protein